ncbi:MAG: hypothetical protein LAT52_11885, partial [Balneolales bacterium]|nr:hypothetical protein [Balneolales bacterium]
MLKRIFLFLIVFSVVSTSFAQDVFTFEDVMQFENLQHPVISDDASWIGYSVWPERGDGEARFEPLSGRSNP